MKKFLVIVGLALVGLVGFAFHKDYVRVGYSLPKCACK